MFSDVTYLCPMSSLRFMTSLRHPDVLFLLGTPAQLIQLDKNVHTMNSALHNMSMDWYIKLQQQGRTDMAVVTQSYQEGVGPTLDKYIHTHTHTHTHTHIYIYIIEDSL